MEKETGIANMIAEAIVFACAEAYSVFLIDGKMKGLDGTEKSITKYIGDMEKIVSSDMYVEWKEFFNTETITKRLREKKLDTYYYRTVDGTWYRGIWIPAKMEENIAVYIVMHADDSIIERHINVINGIISKYVMVLSLDLNINVCYAISQDDCMDGLLPDRGDAQACLTKYVEEAVFPDNQEEMSLFVDLTTLNERISDENTISQEFMDGYSGSWNRAEFVVSERDRDGIPTHLLFNVYSIEEEKTQELYIQDLYTQLSMGLEDGMEASEKALHDPMTGMLNRAGFESVIESMEEDAKLGYALIDVDKFKSINDTYGHDIGDQILIKVAKTLTGSVRSTDNVIRFGGDEFAVLFNGATESFADRLVEKFQKVNEVLLNPDDGLPPISLSVGVAFSDTGYHKDLYNMADAALYVTKENGRCGCNVYHGEPLQA